MSSPNEIKKGTVINWNNDLWTVVDFQRVSPGKGGSFVRTKMKSLSSGKVNEQNFKTSENLIFEDVKYKKMQFIFSDEISLTFMDGITYEQIALDKEIAGEDAKYLKEGLKVTVVMHDNNAVAMELPGKVEYRIVETDPAVRGDTVSGNVLKDAVLDNGLSVKVPIFINTDDKIKVNTVTGEYVERVS